MSNLSNEFRIASITISHATAPVDVRELLANVNWPALLATHTIQLQEWAIINTCHRFEMLLVVDSNGLQRLFQKLPTLLDSFIQNSGSDSAHNSDTPWYIRTDEDSVLHLCRVAAGLDSLVLGEAQIQGQVISAYSTGMENGCIGPLLSTCFRTAIRVGKRARSETQISNHAQSMSSLALNMAARYVPYFADANVLVIGAGEMSRLALKSLLQRQVSSVTVANRTVARAESVLMHPNWRAITLEESTKNLALYDVIFSATSASEFVIRPEFFANVGAHGDVPGKKVLIDLAVPRDIDPLIRELPEMVLIDVDDLRLGLDQSLEKRRQALPAVNAIIDEEFERWQAERRELAIRPVVSELRQRAERIRQEEVERTIRFMGAVDADTREHIQHLTRALVNKLLHEPTIRIKELAHSEDADQYVATICDIFGLGSTIPDQMPAQDATFSSDYQVH